MAFVVDASLAAAWFLPDEASAATTALARRSADEPCAVPSLFVHEMRNLFLFAIKRGRIAENVAFTLLSHLDKMPLRDHGVGDSAPIARLAIKHGLTGYDAAYLALALAENLPLATLDKKLATAARAENVTLLGPLATS
jgi:predicted nucleic acid-binding protein